MGAPEISHNPLLAAHRGPIRFRGIQAEHVEPAIAELLARAREAVEDIARRAGGTYAETLGALEDATEPLEVAMTLVEHLESVCSSDALRDAHNKVQPEISAFFASLPLHAGLYRALRGYAATDDAARLPPTKRRYLEKTLDDFRRHGAELDPAGKARLEAISRELAELTNRYSQNVLDATSAFELVITDEAKLAGLPDSAREAARQSAAQKGKAGWRFSLHAPSVIPVITYLDDRGIRETISRAFNTRATEGELDNRPLVGRILELRREKARLLGYRDFADLVTEDRMAKSGARAREFVADLERRSRPAFERENAELLAFARSLGFVGELRPWDVAYYAEKLRKARFDYDEEALRPYFPVDQVMTGLFRTVERLYGVTVEPAEAETWHGDVRAYRIVDADRTELGLFYADLFPRDEKRGGAWMNGIVTGVLSGGGLSRPHVGLIAANVSPPVGDRPALLLHDEVETMFHEFGHLMHHMLTRVEVRGLAGTHVAWDFVELPSQIMENWCWERAALDLFARHHETHAPIPDELFARMKSARTYRAANMMMRQLGFATVDLELHRTYEPAKDGDPTRYARDLLARFSPASPPEEFATAASFGHLFGSEVGYAAGYYSYKWAEVLDADAFTRFQGSGVFSPEVGRAFRSEVLAKGDSAEPEALFRAFMGRDPSIDALLRRSGLADAQV